MPDFNWDAVSATAEAVGVLAVVVSLIYLATQVRFARLAAADTTRHIRADGVRQAMLMMGNNPEFAKLWLKATGTESIYESLGEKLDFTGVRSCKSISCVSTGCGCIGTN
jgi:hypothetical protein